MRARVILAIVVAIAAMALFALWVVKRPDGRVVVAPDASDTLEASWIDESWTEPPENIFTRIPAPDAAEEFRCATDIDLPPSHRASKPLMAAADALVAAGLPDPRGCE